MFVVSNENEKPEFKKFVETLRKIIDVDYDTIHQKLRRRKIDDILKDKTTKLDDIFSDLPHETLSNIGQSLIPLDSARKLYMLYQTNFRKAMEKFLRYLNSIVIQSRFVSEKDLLLMIAQIKEDYHYAEYRKLKQILLKRIKSQFNKYTFDQIDRLALMSIDFNFSSIHDDIGLYYAFGRSTSRSHKNCSYLL